MSKNLATLMASSLHDDVSLQGFAMLDAVMFEWRDGRFNWLDIDQAAKIFICGPDHVPSELSSLVAKLTPEGRAARLAALRALTWDGASYKVSYQILKFDGQLSWVEERGRRVSGEGRGPSHIIGVIRDTQIQKMAEQRAAFLSTHDALTGLWNKTRLDEALVRVIASSERYDRPAIYMGIQIANLDDINQTYGYDAGDRLIKGVAARLGAHIRIPDLLARTHGNRFAVVDCDCEAETAKVLAKQLIALLSDAAYPSPYGNLNADFAIGSVQIPLQTQAVSSIDSLVSTALYHSQKQGGAYVPHSDDLPDIVKTRPQSDVTEVEILDTLNSRMIALAYQPIVHAATAVPHHYECLLRLKRDSGELVPAGEFIMAAERLGLVHLLDRRALEIASETLKNVPDVLLALNISAATVKDEEIACDYISALGALGPDTRRVTIELTETLALEDPELASQFSNEVRALGCSFAIDDFGAGHTSFQNLMAIEADEIKIDGSFIRELSTTPHKQAFVRMMVDLAQTFSVKTVAEFVNSREDADLLIRFGVDYLQGYMFGVPSADPDWGGSDKAKTASAAG